MQLVNNTYSKLFWIVILISLGSCKDETKTPLLFQKREATGIDFSNTIHNTPDFNIFSYRNFYNGGGVGLGDINNDGLADIFFTANMGPNKLYLNKGNWKFDDITEKSGLLNRGKWGTGIVMVDINADGWLDIYVCYAGYQKGIQQENELYINNQDGTFTESAKQYGLDDTGYTTHAAFFDYDLDGDLDAYILKNSFIPVNTLNYSNKRELRAKDWPVADFLKGGGDKLLRNDNGKFTDVSEEAGIFGSLIGFGLGVTVGDINNDGYPDLYISNDFFERDYLYINQKNGKFTEELEQRMQHISLSSMGADIGDINNDGYQDIFTTDMLPNTESRLKTTATFENIDVYNLTVKQGFYHQFMQNALQVNNQNGQFLETAQFSGVAASDWSWGGLLFDMDNDGNSDIYICNGIYHDVTDQDFIEFFADEVIQKMALTGRKEQIDEIIKRMPSSPIPNVAYRNLGKLKFTDETIPWGLDQPSFSNGAAYGDLDNDGDLDLVVNNVNSQAFIYSNNSNEVSGNKYIGITLRGKGLNTYAVGSTIKLFCADEIISRQVMPGRGFQSSVDYKNIIGLGKKQIDSILIIWPNQVTSRYVDLQTDTVYILQQPEGNAVQIDTIQELIPTYLNIVSTSFESHKEDDYVDFYYERNIPVMQSKEGPKAAIGDVNGDGLDDVYIGGAANQPGQLYMQQQDGFVKNELPVFKLFAEFEDEAVMFFDCDRDGDLDLFVGSGGNKHPPGSRELLNRLYINDGKGNFEISSDQLPGGMANTSVAIAHDIDGDGDLDLFVGSRSIPLDYGSTPISYLLINDGKGKFTDIAKGSALSNAGMIRDAKWVDVNADGQKELVVVGEWMQPRIFSVANNRFNELTSGLENYFGLWQAVTSCDIDGDGDEDLILGNYGGNFYLKPEQGNPVKLWINDFDENNTRDKIITRNINGKDLPVFMKRELTEQIPGLKKQNLKHKDFAEKSIQELFSNDQIKKSAVKKFSYPYSCIAINQGDGKFIVQELPQMVQLSCVNAIQCTDINGDGFQDIVMGGNNFNFLPQFSRLDASFGHMLLNDGKGSFKWISNKRSGLNIREVIKDIRKISFKQREHLLILQNNDAPVLFNMIDRKNLFE